MIGWMNDIRWREVQLGRPEEEFAPVERPSRREDSPGRPIISVIIILATAIPILKFTQWFTAELWLKTMGRRIVYSPEGPPLDLLRQEYLQSVGNLFAGLLIWLVASFSLWWEGRRKGWSSDYKKFHLAEATIAILCLGWYPIGSLVFILLNTQDLFDAQFATTTWSNQAAYETDPHRMTWMFRVGFGCLLVLLVFNVAGQWRFRHKANRFDSPSAN